MKQLIRDIPYIAVGMTMIAINAVGNFVSDLYESMNDAR